MKKVKEVIVVEGKSDTQNLNRYLDVDTIETNGSAISEKTLQLIKKAHEQRGVIVFTDPDFPGQKIRQTVVDYIPGVKQAYITQDDARSARENDSLGVEHASKKAVLKGLEAVRVGLVDYEEMESDITPSFLMANNLLGGPGAKLRRQILGEILHVGYANGKQLKKRLDMFGIRRKEVEKAINEMNEGGHYE